MPTLRELESHDEWGALVTGICHEPKNDLRRLVAADWLEERGEERYAEFIRLQVEIASICGDRSVPPYSDEMNAVVRQLKPYRDRERELWDRNREEWFGDPTARQQWARLVLGYDEPNRLPVVEAVVERGFVTKMRAPFGWFVGSGLCPAMCFDGLKPGRFGGVATCVRCHGTGRSTGVLANLCRWQPVTSAVATDTNPDIIHHDDLGMGIGGVWWIDDGSNQEGSIPAAVWNHLPGGLLVGGTGKGYDSDVACSDALSAAIVEYVRLSIGLPPIHPAATSAASAASAPAE